MKISSKDYNQVIDNLIRARAYLIDAYNKLLKNRNMLGYKIDRSTNRSIFDAISLLEKRIKKFMNRIIEVNKRENPSTMRF